MHPSKKVEIMVDRILLQSDMMIDFDSVKELAFVLLCFEGQLLVHFSGLLINLFRHQPMIPKMQQLSILSQKLFGQKSNDRALLFAEGFSFRDSYPAHQLLLKNVVWK